MLPLNFRDRRNAEEILSWDPYVYSYSENKMLVGWKLFSQKSKFFENLSKIKIFRKKFLGEQSRGKKNYGNIISGLESCSGGLSVIETMSKVYVKRHS